MICHLPHLACQIFAKNRYICLKEASVGRTGTEAKLTAVLAYHMDAGLNPSCSSFYLADVSRKVIEDGPNAWVPIPLWETQKNSWPSYGP